MDIGLTFRAGSNTLRFANYVASRTGKDNAGTEMTEVSISVVLAEGSTSVLINYLKSYKNLPAVVQHEPRVVFKSFLEC